MGPSLLTARWTQLPYHPTVRASFESPHRFNVVPAGRRSLKTETRKRKLVQRALRGGDYGPARFFFAAPTRDQAKRIAWEDIKQLSPPWAVRDVSESDLTVTYQNGSMIQVHGMDRPERIEGSPWDGGVLDEYANMRPHVWSLHVRPALADRRGWCDLIGVPEGRNHYYDIAMRAQAEMLEHGAESDWGFYTWRSADILPAEEIEAARRDLDELSFRQEYEASFINFTGRAYYAFGEENKGRLHYVPAGDIAFCFDFNVSPGVAVVVQEQELPTAMVGTGVIGEVHIPQNSNTEAVCNKLIADWGDHDGRVFVYGDATGGARGTAKVSGSDWDIVRRMMFGHFGSDRVFMRVGASNPAERARVNAVNTRCCAGDGSRRLVVDPSRAPNVVRDLEGVRVLSGGSGEIDKKADPTLSHLSDALGYYVEKEYPITERVTRSGSFKVV